MSTPDQLDLGDGKAPDAFRTIGEVSKALGIRQHVLRYWEDQFPMLRPLTRAGGRRYYRPSDVALVAEIDRLLNQQGYTIKGARQALRGARPEEAQAVPDGVAVAETEGSEPVGAASVPAQVVQAIRDRLAAALVD